jgi:uncharacterized membrane protein
MNPTGRPLRTLPKHRAEGLTDGIYAVAMTLLVLELKIPEGVTLANERDLLVQLAHLVPRFVAWVISFLILAVFWMSHQRAFHFVRVVDAKLLWINVIALLFAGLLPFSSALVGEHTGLFWAHVFYAANMAALALAALWQITHIERHPELWHVPLPWYVAKAARFRCWSLVAVAALAVAFAAIDPRIGTLAFMLMFLLGRMGRRMEAREAEKAALTPTESPSP